ncbi:MAG: FAD-binding oxidoreductase [Armatimonadetes bacterium]|nr:FAD-binding oxidoreductase [Armatimonadota bacterium]
MDRADVVVIGAGIVGLSVAFHLLARDRTLRVVVLDQADYAGAGSTSKATGGVRRQFGNTLLVRLSQRSIEEYGEFRAITGVDAEFERAGYLLFATSEPGARRLLETAALQHACGSDVAVVGADEIARGWPYLNPEDVRLGTYTAGDGHVNPYAAVTGYLQGIRAAGGSVLFGEPVTGIAVEAGRVAGVQTSRRFVPAPVVVNAAGVRAREVAAMVGQDLPVRPVHTQVAILTAVPLGVTPVPFTIHVDSGWYLHHQRDGTILLGGFQENPGTEEVPDPAVTERFIETGLARVPRLAEASLVRAYAGLRAMTPDDLPILGPLPAVPGFFYACGLGGHGIMHAPAVGEAVARWILEGTVDAPELEACRPDRFAARTHTGTQGRESWVL